MRGEAVAAHHSTAITPAEAAVLRAYARTGMSKLIAHELGISIQTVKNHTSSVIAKLGAASLGHAALIFDREQRDKWPAIERRYRERRRGERRQAVAA